MVRELRVSLSNFFLYTSGNNMALLSIQRLLTALEELFRDLPSVILGESEGRLVVEGTPLDEHTTGSTNMIKDLFLTHKIHSLTFQKGITLEEVKMLFSLLKPKGLPTGLSFSQALVQHSLEHIRANEKVFVAVGEGEVVVPAGAVGGGGGEQNLQEALEALQYFLQIFARIKPDSNKHEVARKLFDNMGDWLKTEGHGTVQGAEQASPATAQVWTDLLGGFMALKNNLTAAPVKDVQIGMDELLKKLVILGEAQGIQIQETDESIPLFQATDVVPEQTALFEADPVLAAIDEGRWEIFWDPNLEEKVVQRISELQDPEKLEAFEGLWNGLWKKIFSADEKTQALCLRHLNRFQWNRMPRALQMEGFRNLRKFLLENDRSTVYPIALTLLQDWIPSELAHPDWEEIVEMARLLKEDAEKKPPSFEKQNEAAKVALETIFCEPILDSLLKRYQAGTREGDGLLKLFTLLGNRVSPFLFQKMEEEPLKSPEWSKAVDCLAALQAGGARVFEFWLEWPEKRNQLEKFLEIFSVKPLTGEMADYFERHWTSFGPSAQSKILGIAEQWKRADFRGLLLELLRKPESPLALQALQVLSKVGLEGDSQAIAEAVKQYPAHAKGRELFWMKACQTMGELEDPSGVEFLIEWADKYKMMESRKNRSLEVRRTALEALGHFNTPSTIEFLTGLQKDAEKELRPTIDQSLKSVGQR